MQESALNILVHREGVLPGTLVGESWGRRACLPEPTHARAQTECGWDALDQNEAFKGILVLLMVGAPFDSATATLDSWTGLAVPLLLLAALVLTKRLPVPNPLDLRNAAPDPIAPDVSGITTT
jgi:hypothetical protein